MEFLNNTFSKLSISESKRRLTDFLLLMFNFVILLASASHSISGISLIFSELRNNGEYFAVDNLREARSVCQIKRRAC